jgi:hypothetical protein
MAVSMRRVTEECRFRGRVGRPDCRSARTDSWLHFCGRNHPEMTLFLRAGAGDVYQGAR